MNKIRFQQVLIVVLLISNVLLLLFGFVLRGPHPDRDGPKRIVIEKLGLDEAQVKKYESFIAWHRRNIRTEDEKIRRLKESLYVLLKTGEQSPEADSLIARISREQQNVEEIHFQHFLQIRSLCRKDQLEDFNKLADELADVFRMNRTPGR